MSVLEISALNLGQKLALPETQDPTLAHLKDIIGERAGILCVSEVMHPGPGAIPAEDVRECLRDFAEINDRTLFLVPYEDQRKRSNEPPDWQQHMGMLVPKSVDADVSETRFATRNGVGARFGWMGTLVDVRTIHDDDRSASARKANARAYVSSLDEPADGQPKLDVLIGDTNYRQSGVKSGLLAAASPGLALLAALTGTRPEGPDMNKPTGYWQQMQRTLSVAYRAAKMGLPGARRVLAEAGFADADDLHRPTHQVGQLDRMLYKAVGLPSLKTTLILGKKGTSDHLPITVQFEV